MGLSKNIKTQEKKINLIKSLQNYSYAHSCTDTVATDGWEQENTIQTPRCEFLENSKKVTTLIGSKTPEEARIGYV